MLQFENMNETTKYSSPSEIKFRVLTFCFDLTNSHMTHGHPRPSLETSQAQFFFGRSPLCWSFMKCNSRPFYDWDVDLKVSILSFVCVCFDFLSQSYTKKRRLFWHCLLSTVLYNVIRTSHRAPMSHSETFWNLQNSWNFIEIQGFQTNFAPISEFFFKAYNFPLCNRLCTWIFTRRWCTESRKWLTINFSHT